MINVLFEYGNLGTALLTACISHDQPFKYQQTNVYTEITDVILIMKVIVIITRCRLLKAPFPPEQLVIDRHHQHLKYFFRAGTSVHTSTKIIKAIAQKGPQKMNEPQLGRSDDENDDDDAGGVGGPWIAYILEWCMGVVYLWRDRKRSVVNVKQTICLNEDCAAKFHPFRDQPVEAGVSPFNGDSTHHYTSKWVRRRMMGPKSSDWLMHVRT